MNLNHSLNIIFAGTPAFSATTLDALIHSSHKVVAVYTQPDRPAGRGRKLTPSSVKELALKHHLPIYQPLTLRDENEQKIFASLHADLMVVVAYGLLLPKPILQVPRLGCMNIHASLLPRWRGAAPIQRAILAGDQETGVTIMQMDEGLDTGPMLYKSHCVIQEQDTSESLYHRLAVIGAEALLATLAKLPQINAEEQDGSLATYASKITKEEALINWNSSAEEISRQIRAFNPWPIAYTHCREYVVRIWEAIVIEKTVANNKPGEILHSSVDGIDVATKNNVLRLLKIQLPGGRVLAVADVLNSRHDDYVVGQLLG